MAGKTPVIVKKTKNGKGLFANRVFRAGQKITEFKGELKHYTELLKRPGKFQNNGIRFNLNYYLSPEGELGAFINHSCSTNGKVVKLHRKLYLVALQPIATGEEVTMDYSATLAADDIWIMKCKCGSSNCRKLIRNYTYLPKKLLRDYKTAHIIPDYILRIK